MHSNGNPDCSKVETNGSNNLEDEEENHVANNLNNKLVNQNGHSSNSVSQTGRVCIPNHQKDTIRLIGQHLLELGLQ